VKEVNSAVRKYDGRSATRALDGATLIEGPGGEICPGDEHRGYPFLMPVVFDGALEVLKSLGLSRSYSNIRQGRIIAHRGTDPDAGHGYLDIKMMPGRDMTLVHVRTGINRLSGRRTVKELRRQFLWELDRWLHTTSPRRLMATHRRARRVYGDDGPTRAPAQAAYKLGRRRARDHAKG